VSLLIRCPKNSTDKLGSSLTGPLLWHYPKFSPSSQKSPKKEKFAEEENCYRRNVLPIAKPSAEAPKAKKYQTLKIAVHLSSNISKQMIINIIKNTVGDKNC